jgi:CDK5 regulatory subunit-associated protein 3
MKDWAAVLKLYEKDSMYMGEAAQILTRNVSYEILSVKKQITQLEKLSEEAAKKSIDSVKSENFLRNEYNTSCQQLGNKGDNIKAELTSEMLKDLPDLQSQATFRATNIARQS